MLGHTSFKCRKISGAQFSCPRYSQPSSRSLGSRNLERLHDCYSPMAGKGFPNQGVQLPQKASDSFTLSSTFIEYELGPDWRLYKLNLTCIVFAVFNMFCLPDRRDFIVSSDGIIVSQWGAGNYLTSTNCLNPNYQLLHVVVPDSLDQVAHKRMVSFHWNICTCQIIH